MKTLKIAFGTLFGSGLLPKAPGTWGSLLTLPVVCAAYLVHPSFGIAGLVLLASLISLWATDACVERFGNDPGQFVIDETAGQSVVFLFTSFHYSYLENSGMLLAGFILFRIFDIVKPLGIVRLEKLPGKFGILFDDLAAGVYALICLELLKVLLGSILG
ncbi:phosphatidylglycerophosphatase A [Rhodohalobacter sp.]|uniref:phosphatidylglycerophosphatase A family protein n=1 Tax=Rhodohalobacter sp. TaxID=1974210 RepID=UPI00356AAE4F